MSRLSKFLDLPDGISDDQLRRQMIARTEEIIRDRQRMEGRPPYPPVEVTDGSLEEIDFIIRIGVPA